jgi:transcriptional regulator with XRE-family HTH domain
VTFTQAMGALIKDLRGEMTQGELAKKSGVKQSTISAIEIGNRTFRGVHIEAILRATETSGVEATRLLRAKAEELRAKQQPSSVEKVDGHARVLSDGDRILRTAQAAKKAPHAKKPHPAQRPPGPSAKPHPKQP